MSDTRELSPQPLAPAFIGLASPLWGYFAGMAAGGVAFWWMTRWTQPQNLEALFARRFAGLSPELAPAVADGADPQAAPDPETAVAMMALEPVIAAVEAAEEPFVELAAETERALESAVEAAPEPAPAAPEPASFAPAADALPEPEPAPVASAAPRKSRPAAPPPAEPPAE
ncbi:hypothetical protein [Phenylobacterium sp.]|uniref:hypothetical protein n=1 Tax=Phenylobacterium sp. TaxID=1871053 RepID=UPI002B594198|nr:hypothetical protein [Phenylobacterium sp.]HVI33310.1 hypothetical protein [Phenylobacterium sp.]